MTTPKTVTADYVIPDRGTEVGIPAIRTTTLNVTGTSTVDTQNIDRSDVVYFRATDRENIPSHAANPAVAANGDIYYNTVTGRVMVYALGAWTTSAVSTAYAMFYGLPVGTGNVGANDYAATVAVKTVAGTGRVPFPRDGPTTGVITRADSSSFVLPAVASYHVVFSVHTTETGQLQLELAGVDQPATCVGDFCPTAGGHLFIGDSIITTTAVNQVLAVINPVANATALTVTAADANKTHANAQTITITML